jgi:hypothetical protein
MGVIGLILTVVAAGFVGWLFLPPKVVTDKNATTKAQKKEG